MGNPKQPALIVISSSTTLSSSSILCCVYHNYCRASPWKLNPVSSLISFSFHTWLKATSYHSKIVKLFYFHGVKSTIITTPLNASFFTKATQRSKILWIDHEIELIPIKFPSVEVGLPEKCESCELVTTPEMEGKFFIATSLLEPQLEQI